ncbi:MAG: DNA primase [Gemmatimonadota bacterium]
MPIPDHVVDEIRDRADIVEVIGEVVELKKRGRNFVGLCPFHAEKTPSFTVTPEKQMYYCFGCQAGGNAFTFLMQHEKLEFPDAARVLADRVGVEIPEPAAAEGPDPHAALYLANRLAAEFYHRRLLEADDGEPARAYLEGRKIRRETWEMFLLGWAPDSWEALIEEAKRQKVDVETLAEAGLAARSDRTGGWYDRFRGRVCCPIRTVGGKVVALSGRRLDDEEPKYLNSSDTPVFSKGSMLYNLDLARGPIRRAGAVVVVEGNFDVVGLAQAGFRNVVAPLGTALTQTQARILRRYTRTAYLANDGDPAGERAAFRAADLLLGAGFAVRIVRIAAGMDPDQLVRDGGPAAFEEALEKSEDVIDAKIALIAERVDLSDVMKKRRAVRRLMESVARVPDPVTRALYVDRVASGLHVPREALEVPDREPGRRGSRREPASEGLGTARPAKPAPAGGRSPRGIVPPEVQDERYLLLHALAGEHWLAEAKQAVAPEFFQVTAYADVFRRLADSPSTAAGERLVSSEDPAIQRVLAELEVWREEQGFPLSDEAFRDSLRRLQLKAVERGVLPELQPTGEPLADAVDRSRLRREIRRGRHHPARSTE